MTTIAYKDGVIAYDSRITEPGNGAIISDHHTKIRKGVDSQLFFLAGDEAGIQYFMNKLLNRELPDIDCDCYGMRWDTVNNTLHCVDSYSDKHYLELRLDTSGVYAYGSGGNFALAAMDFGKSAAEAVAYAATRDVWTGGKVNSFICEGIKGYHI